MDFDGVHLGILTGAFLYGLRHGIDLDHLAAISDITISQPTNKARALRLATAYALGHGIVVLILGSLAVVAGHRLPEGLDRAMEHVVGISLLALAAYVFYSLIRYGRDFRLRSRWIVLFEGVRRTFRWLKRQPVPERVEIEHSHDGDQPGHDHVAPLSATSSADRRAAITTRTTASRHRHVLTLPEDPFVTYGIGTAAGIGMIHGIGAETPTQVLLLVTAAGVEGTAAGGALLVVFIGGLLVSNTAVAVGSVVGFAKGNRAPAIYLTLALVTGFASLVMGALYLSGRAGLLPSFFG